MRPDLLEQTLNITPPKPYDPENTYLCSLFTRDWRKPDLSPDLIAFAAPDVEHVNLYWSGNQTVLKGWGSLEGIPNLAKLKSLRLYASPVCLCSVHKRHVGALLV